jgi:F0F1-type ATP synthase alpha subunit
MALSVGPGELKTETVEEFISISDGQVVLEPSMSVPSSSESVQGPVAFSINPKLSITRIGSRAYSKALEQLAPQIRLDLAQAEDARKFATNQDDPVLRK